MKSKIIIGCMTWGKWGKQLLPKEQTELIHFCVEQGFTTFDHADIYGDYTTEGEFGSAFAKSRIPRSKISLTSKCGIQLIGESRPNKVKHYNYNKDYIIWSAENSMRLLKTDYIDTFLLHRPSPLMEVEEVAEAANQLLDSGKIRQFGVSNFTPSQVELLSQHIKIEVNQVEFSLTQTNVINDGTLDQAQIKKIDIQAWSPMGSFFREDNTQIKSLKPLVKDLAIKYGISENQLLLAWLLKHPVKLSPVIGTTNKERIGDSKKALQVDLEIEDWFLLLEASMGHEVA